MSFQSLSELVKHYESGGNYTKINPASSASGAYQFTNSTWAQYAGPDLASQYPTAASAPAAVQDQVFATAVSKRGLADWTCPNCDPALTAHLASNPGDANLPLFGGGQLQAGNQAAPFVDSSGSPINTGWQGIPNDPSMTGTPGATPTPLGIGTNQGVPSGSMTSDQAAAAQPGTLLDQPFSLGLTFGLSKAVNDWITGAETAVGTWATNAAKSAFATLENWVSRAGLILLAIVIIALALWRLMDPGGEKLKAAVSNAAVAA